VEYFPLLERKPRPPEAPPPRSTEDGSIAVAPTPTPAEAYQRAAELERRYYSEPDLLTRTETVYQLADANTAAAQTTLARLYYAEQDVELKINMLQAIPFFEGGDRTQTLAMLQSATLPTERYELRSAALEVLQDLADPATLPIVQRMANDADPEIRETAQKTAGFLKEVIELEKAQ
jgi:HEAT repeat protein